VRLTSARENADHSCAAFAEVNLDAVIFAWAADYANAA